MVGAEDPHLVGERRVARRFGLAITLATLGLLVVAKIAGGGSRVRHSMESTRHSK